MSDRQGSGPQATDHFVTAADLDRVPPRVASSPLPTVFTLTRDALRNGRRGTPAAWRAAALARLRRRDAVTLAPVADARCHSWPDPLDHNEARHETFEQALERIAATPAETLLEPLEGDPDIVPGSWWDGLRRDPQRWQRSYVDALQRAWLGLGPLWRRSAGLVEREIDRIDAAVDRGVPTTQIIADVHTRAALAEDRLRLAPTAGESRRLQVRERGVILSPMIAAGRGGIIATTGGWFVRTAYPLSEAWRAFDDRAPEPASLEGLLGAQRSRVLRQLDRTYIAGELSQALGWSPSGMSYHLRALETAGLVTRERRGENVLVRRTHRGTVLLALYELP
jgi:DNA-binding transcriptional ArsR family regulator